MVSKAGLKVNSARDLAPLLLPLWRRNQKHGLFIVQTLLLMVPVLTALYLAAQAGALDFE